VRSIPIRVRVAGAFALAMAVVLAATGTFVYLRLGSHLSTALDNELRVRAGDLSALVAHHGSLEAAGGGRFVEHGEAYAELLDSRGRVLDATGSLGRVPLLRPDELGRAARGTIFADRSTVPGLDEPSRLLATPLDRDGKRLVLVVGATRQDRAETLASLRDELLIAGPIALLLATAAGFALAGLALRAVEAMRSRAATISAERPGERLPVPRTRDELERLGETLNAMLDRLEAAIAHERRFVADAGHELRTPLALLRTELELALRHGRSTEELRESIRVSAAEVDRLSQLADDLLLIARTGD
jgi:signal transduction histidine kinase